MTIFAKGNVDVRDTLHAQRLGDSVTWNGLNQVLRKRQPEWRARIRHEPCTRFDALAATNGVIPDAIAARSLPLGPYPPEIQYSAHAFDAENDVVVLSLQPEVMNGLARHRREGHLVCPYGLARWDEEDRRWFASQYEAVPLLTAEQSMNSLRRLIDRLRQSVEHILVFNMSPVVPGERLHSPFGMGETLSTRIRRFNLALIDVAREIEFSIVDVDTLLARHGADELKVDAVHFTPAGCALIADEVVSILEERGCFE